MEVLRPHIYRFYHFVSRTPKQVASYTSTAKPFFGLFWAMIALTLFCFHIIIYIAHSMYASSFIALEKLHKGQSSFAKFGISVYFKVTEPEAIDMFSHKWSTGRLLSFLWTVFCFFVIAFYNSNLRAHLAAITYEAKIETTQDVVNKGERVWISTEMEGNL